METTELTVTDMAFDPVTDETITVSISNTGTSDATIASIKVNGNNVDLAPGATPVAPYLSSAASTLSYTSGTSGTLEITMSNVVAGNKYAVNLFAGDGTLIGSFTDTA
jgi:hypothetical protein